MKQIGKYCLIFLTLVVLCTLALVGAALIPKDRIRSSIETSVDYLASHEVNFGRYLIDDMEGSKVDETADANLLNIAWFWDNKHPLDSALRCNCYFEYEKQIEMLHEAVFEKAEPNQQYFRYWHGSLLFVRPLLMWLELKGIYTVHYVVMALLFLGLLAVLFCHHMNGEAIGLILSMIAVNLWVVPMCLEFTWMFFVMFVVSIIAVHFAQDRLYDRFGLLFFVTGIVTIFLDFFTTETLTVLVPLMLTLRIRSRQREEGQLLREGDWLFSFHCCILWALGYVLMWAAKWALASVVLKINAFSAIKPSIELHLSKLGYETKLQYILSILQRNIRCLFPIGNGVIGAVVTFLAILIFVFLPVLSDRVRLRQSIRWSQVGLYAGLGLVPYIRYMIIPHHSWVHSFFTYRAQAASILALCFIVAEVVEIRRPPTHTVPMPVSTRSAAHK